MDRLLYTTQHLEPPNSKTVRSNWVNGQGKNPGWEPWTPGLTPAHLRVSHRTKGHSTTSLPGRQVRRIDMFLPVLHLDVEIRMLRGTVPYRSPGR